MYLMKMRKRGSSMNKVFSIPDIIESIEEMNMLQNYKFNTAQKDCIEKIKEEEYKLNSNPAVLKCINSLRKRTGSYVATAPVAKYNEAISYISKELENKFRAKSIKVYEDKRKENKSIFDDIIVIPEKIYFLSTYVKGNINEPKASFFINVEECDVLKQTIDHVIVKRYKKEFNTVLETKSIGIKAYASCEEALNVGLKKFSEYNTDIALSKEPVISITNKGKSIIPVKTMEKEELEEEFVM